MRCEIRMRLLDLYVESVSKHFALTTKLGAIPGVAHDRKSFDSALTDARVAFVELQPENPSWPSIARKMAVKPLNRGHSRCDLRFQRPRPRDSSTRPSRTPFS